MEGVGGVGCYSLDAEPEHGSEGCGRRRSKLELANGELGWMNSRGGHCHTAGFYEPHVLDKGNVWQLELN